MAGITTTWDIAVPAGSEDPKNGDNRIVELKTALTEILRNGGHQLSNGPTTDTSNGRHLCGEENQSGGAGSPLTGEFYVYAADGTTRIVTISDSTAASPSRFYAPTLVATFANQRTIAMPLVGTAGVQAGVYFENRSPQSFTIQGIKLVAGTGPTGTDLVVNVLRNASGYANPGSGGTSVLTTPASDLKIAAGSRVGTETTAIVGAQSVIAQGDSLYVSITTLSAATDIVVYIRVK